MPRVCAMLRDMDPHSATVRPQRRRVMFKMADPPRVRRTTDRPPRLRRRHVPGALTDAFRRGRSSVLT